MWVPLSVTCVFDHLYSSFFTTRTSLPQEAEPRGPTRTPAPDAPRDRLADNIMQGFPVNEECLANTRLVVGNLTEVEKCQAHGKGERAEMPRAKCALVCRTREGPLMCQYSRPWMSTSGTIRQSNSGFALTRTAMVRH